MTHRQYVAITTSDPEQYGWHIVHIGRPGEKREEVSSLASRQIIGDSYYFTQADYEAELKNLQVVPLSVVKRKHRRELENFWQQIAAVVRSNGPKIGPTSF